jgi:hypothetical protein
MTTLELFLAEGYGFSLGIIFMILLRLYGKRKRSD